jgi:hypothetical protein
MHVCGEGSILDTPGVAAKSWCKVLINGTVQDRLAV